VTVVTSVIDGQDGRTAFQTSDTRAAEATSQLRTDGFTATIPLKDLKPGTYVLRVEASSSADRTSAVREVMFDVR
jgi:hypothetical protein